MLATISKFDMFFFILLLLLFYFFPVVLNQWASVNFQRSCRMTLKHLR